MGKQTENLKSFRDEDIQNRDLILRMLKYEDELYMSEEGQNLLKQRYMQNISSLEGGKTIQRRTLQHFGYDSTDEDLAKYRTIFYNYYNSPTDYDEDVLKSVYYMRENRLLYYTTPKPQVLEEVPNVELYEIDGQTKRTLHDILDDKASDSIYNTQKLRTIIASFSCS